MRPDDYYWMCPKDLYAVSVGYERRQRASWERALMLRNLWVAEQDRRTYDDLMGGGGGVAIKSKEDFEKLKQRFNRKKDG